MIQKKWLSACVIGVAAALCASLTALAQTACPSYPVTLQNGTIADAAEVMADFNAIRDCVNSNAGLLSVALTSAGTANVQTLAATSVTQYVVGQRMLFKIGGTNTGAVTLNVNGLGAKAIKDELGFALLGGELLAGTLAEPIYDGTDLRLVGSRGDRILSGQTASASATVDFTGLTGAYREYEVRLSNVVLTTDNEDLNVLISVGGTFMTANYAWMKTMFDGDAGTVSTVSPSSYTRMILAHNVGNNGARVLDGTIKIIVPAQTAAPKKVLWDGAYTRGSGHRFQDKGWGALHRLERCGRRHPVLCEHWHHCVRNVPTGGLR